MFPFQWHNFRQFFFRSNSQFQFDICAKMLNENVYVEGFLLSLSLPLSLPHTHTHTHTLFVGVCGNMNWWFGKWVLSSRWNVRKSSNIKTSTCLSAKEWLHACTATIRFSLAITIKHYMLMFVIHLFGFGVKLFQGWKAMNVRRTT